MAAARTAREPPTITAVCQESQSNSVPANVIHSSRVAIPTEISVAPMMSIRAEPRGRFGSLRVICSTMIEATANGRPTKKFQRQLRASVRKPPRIGPPTMPIPMIEPMRPMYRPRWRGLMMSAMQHGGQRLQAAGADALEGAERDELADVLREARRPRPTARR